MNSELRLKIYNKLNDNHIITKGNCHIWTGSLHRRGYGKIMINRKIYLVHKLAILFFEDLELNTKIQVRHKCINRNCFNPVHLEIR